jgi:signal transduction histidine kinase
MVRTGQLVLWMKKHPLPLGFAAIGSAFSALVVTGIGCGFWQVVFPYEIYVLIGLAWACSVASLIVETAPRFVVAHMLRAVFLVGSLFSFAEWHMAIGLLLAIPFVLDTTLYLRTRSVLVISSCTIAIIFLAYVTGQRQGGTVTMLLEVVSSILLLGVTTALGTLMTRYREAMVAMSAREEQLELSLISLEQANRSYQEYAEKVEQLSEDKERNRITREMHDTIGYALTNIGMLLQAGKAIADKNPERLHELLDAAREQSNAALQESRNILYKLRSPRSTGIQGLQSVHRLARSLQEATGIEVEVSFGNVPWSFGSSIDSAIFRLVQEGITNAIKHGMARRIRITYWLTKDELQVRIWNDGMSPDTVAEGIGIKGMRERFAGFDGSIEASSAPDGFVLTARVPLEALELEDSGNERADQDTHR